MDPPSAILAPAGDHVNPRETDSGGLPPTSLSIPVGRWDDGVTEVPTLRRWYAFPRRDPALVARVPLRCHSAQPSIDSVSTGADPAGLP